MIFSTLQNFHKYGSSWRHKKLLIPRFFEVIAQPGSQVTVVEEKKKENKKLFSIHPFIEGYGFAETDDRKGAGAKAGVRFDF